MTDVHIPPEESDDNVHCTISDSSVRNRAELLSKLALADSIVLVYDAERPDTFNSLGTFWLPLIEDKTKDVPVLVVRNKVDVGTQEGERTRPGANVPLGSQTSALMERFKFVNMLLECSAVTQEGLMGVFHMALTVVLYPLAPLYSAKEDKLTPEFERAVRRIFRVHDTDRDGLLSDKELNAFQYRCFRLNLSEEDILAIKKMLSKGFAMSQGNLAGGNIQGGGREKLVVYGGRGGKGGSLTVAGFLRLFKLFIDRSQVR
ncbi:unnamed protein product [Discosporangium mesarthrocarpum]